MPVFRRRKCDVKNHGLPQLLLLLLPLTVGSFVLLLASFGGHVHGFSRTTTLLFHSSRQNFYHPHLPARRSGEIRKLPTAPASRSRMGTISLLAAETTKTKNTQLLNAISPQVDDDDDEKRRRRQKKKQELKRHQFQHDRRGFVSTMSSSTVGILFGSAASVLTTRPNSASAEEGTSIAAPATVTAATSEQQPLQRQPKRIIRLSSGLQFSDARVGSGSLVKMISSSKKESNDQDDDDDNETDLDDKNVVLMHLKALRRDGSALFDTREEGRPILFKLGSISAEELYYINEGTALSKGRIPLGVQDAILAQGMASWEGGYGKADPMRYGGLRMVVVPPELAYGNNGVSRYEAFKLGMKHPVARNELLRYEIELFRCNDDTIEFSAENTTKKNDKEDSEKSAAAPPPTARACCLDEFYPCQTTPSAAAAEPKT